MAHSTDIILADMDEWDAFANDNREALEADYGSVETALQHARDGGLTLGGGAAPAFFISFADE